MYQIVDLKYNFSKSEIHPNECKACTGTVDLENGLNLIQLNMIVSLYLAS